MVRQKLTWHLLWALEPFLDSKIARGSMKILPADVKIKDPSLGGDAIQKHTPNAYGQAKYVSSVFVLQHQ